MCKEVFNVATADQIKSLIKAHNDNDNEMEILALEALALETELKLLTI